MAQKIGELVRDEAFLIRSVDYGDNHRILNWLSASHGRVHLMAYAARKSQNRLLGMVDYLHCLKIEFKPHSNAGLGQLVRCELVTGFEEIRQSYSKTLMALGWLRILSQALQEGGQVPGLYDLLYDHLRYLEAKEENWVELVFLHRLLTRLGYHVELSRCTQCGACQSSEFHFIAHGGGLHCASCHRGGIKGIVLDQPFPSEYWSLQHELNPWPVAQVNQARKVFHEAFQELLGVFLEDPGV